ncbi:MAG: tetratricopeptide repeat protein [Bacteroidota bacterium]
MKLLHYILVSGIALLWAVPMPAQTADERAEAHRMSVQGLNAMEKGEYRQAIEAFAKAEKLDLRNPQYPIQLAQAYFFDRQFEKTKELVKPMMNRRRGRPEAWQLYGNSLDEQGKIYEALQTYRDGLKRFPNSGLLYLEMGILEYGRDNDVIALQYWEEGIRRNPTFPSNYYFAAKVHHRRGDYVWAAAYAEMYLNLDRIGERTREMSVLLLQAYDDARWFDFQEAFKWKFYQVPESLHVAVAGDTTPVPAYAQQYDEAYASELTDTNYVLTLELLVSLRRFVAFYIPARYPEHPINGLLEWHRLIAGRNHFRAYTYWLLYDARPEEFLAWYEEGRDEYEAFEGWFLHNTYHKHFKESVVREK